MNPPPLQKRDLLDPRPVAEARMQPIEAAVNIPFSELAGRSHELPPKSACIRVAGPQDLALAVVTWLQQRGRTAAIAAAPLPAPAIRASDEMPAATRPAIGRLWEPSAFMEDTAPHLQPGNALDLACGSGRNAVFLASCGWRVTAIDMLPDALMLGQDLERRYAVGCHPITWTCADLEVNWPGPGQRFDLITMFRYLNRPLLSRITQWLNPGSNLVLETFTTVHQQHHGRPASHAHVLRPGELRELVESLSTRVRLCHYSEAWRGEEHTARLWAQCDDQS